jgi:NAD(P)-dependent dehydrogenase (short-subunit alcohol dehydrogenase family)
MPEGSGRLADRVVLITGSTGIAAATAEKAIEEGARVFVCSRTESHCAALVEKLGSQRAGYRAADLVQDEAASAVVEDCRARFGRIDALFNVAGISGRRFGDGPLHECTPQGWDMTMDVNARSQFLMCRAVLQVMLQQAPGSDGMRGSLLNIASVLAFSPERKHFAAHAYAASKGAILGMTKAMAAYYAPEKIRVNAIAPALVRTPMSQRAQSNEEIMAYVKGKQPLVEGMQEADEIADAAVFLMSSGARSITGDVITVDAGWCVSEGHTPKE